MTEFTRLRMVLRKIDKYLDKLYKKDFSTEVIPYLLDKIYCFVTTKENIDIGIRENFNKINRLYLSK